MRKALAMKEPDFQTQADTYAHNSISILADMTGALEHADECDGEISCEKCSGMGAIHIKTAKREYDKTCSACKGTGMVACDAGKDSDDPESWHDRERAQQRILEDALSVEVRGDWHTLGDTDATTPTEFTILLTTGGPAARLIGDLDRGQPEHVRFEFQDWFKPWIQANTTMEEDEVMLTYAQQFYFGD